VKRYLPELLSNLGSYELFGKKNVAISKILDDSRRVRKDSLFVAILGLTFDGHRFIPQAISLGATAVVGEKEPKKSWLNKITYIKVPNSRQALGFLASAWYNYPSKSLKVIGVTGTDGKTTTATLIYWLLNQAGINTGLITTVAARIGEKEYDTGFHVTNPESLPLQNFLKKMLKAGCTHVVLEVTSHGLDQERVAGIDFDIGVLTNITHEHLDYHKTYQRYLEAKAKLFRLAKVAILNQEDKSYKKLRKILGPGKKMIGYNLQSLSVQMKGVVQKRFKEDYNQMNAVAAILAAKELGVKEKIIKQAITNFKGVIGRLEEIKNKRGIKIYIDFAHTPNALEKVLTVLRRRKRGGRLIAVFGCAGERDIKKRPMMAKISTALADLSIFTAEDPRHEDVNEIIKEMEKGVLKNNKRKYLVIPERGEAIAYAIQKVAKKGDIIVICGKGHEKSMCYNGIEYPWSDHGAVKLSLKGKVRRIRR
jgi:UDP-N-acetylmuramoyl-L-alanyl-D-glutamate--2,6-diaminopimelate ligase